MFVCKRNLRIYCSAEILVVIELGGLVSNRHSNYIGKLFSNMVWYCHTYIICEEEIRRILIWRLITSFSHYLICC